MLKRTGLLLMAGTVLSLNAYSADRPGGTSTTTSSSMERTNLSQERIGIRPQLGFMNYNDPTLASYTEMTLGALGEMNALRYVGEMGLGLDPDRYFIGPETGLLFSHLASSGSNVFTVPLNLKVGYLITNQLRAGVHGGANVIYRSTANAMRLAAAPEGTSAALDVFPNVGLDVDYAVSNDVALIFRPDMTFTPGSNIFTASLGVVIPMT